MGPPVKSWMHCRGEHAHEVIETRMRACTSKHTRINKHCDENTFGTHTAAGNTRMCVCVCVCARVSETSAHTHGHARAHAGNTRSHDANEGVRIATRARIDKRSQPRLKHALIRNAHVKTHFPSARTRACASVPAGMRATLNHCALTHALTMA